MLVLEDAYSWMSSACDCTEPGGPVRHGLTAREAAEDATVARGLCRQQRRRQRGSSVLVLEDAYSVQSSSSALRDLRSSRVKALSLGSLRCSCSVSVTISWHWFSSRSKDISSMDGILDTNNHTSGQAITDSDSTNFTGKGQTYL